MFYYLYEIKNLINNKTYVGVHKTNDLNDGYMGSGKVIRAAIKKYGIENFTKVILEFFDTSKAMYAREKEVVTDDFLLREDVYNLRRGGSGGFDYINKDMDESYRNQRRINMLKVDKRVSGKIVGDMNAKKWENNPSSHPGTFTVEFNKEMSVRACSPEANNKRKETFAKIGHQQGEKNSNFGKMWITNGIENKKIKKTNLLPEGFRKGRIVK